QVEELARHVESCEICEKTVQELPGDDTLLGFIREYVQLERRPPGVISQDLKQKLQGLWRLVETPPPACKTLPDAAENDKGLRDYLALTQVPGEPGVLGPYRLLKVVGTGGMGIVFQAEDPHLKRKVALKVLRPLLA